MEDEAPQKLTLEIIGTDSNAFALMGKASSVVQRTFGRDAAAALRKEMFACKSYEALLCLLQDRFEVC